MGARGNSGVITSQILRGLCEGSARRRDARRHRRSTRRSTRPWRLPSRRCASRSRARILTVLRDAATGGATTRARRSFPAEEALDAVVSEAYASVQPHARFAARAQGERRGGRRRLRPRHPRSTRSWRRSRAREGALGDELAFARTAAPKVEIEQINDWEGSRFRYCNEFLVALRHARSPKRRSSSSPSWATASCCVGSVPKFKVHVHSNHPDQVLAYFLERGQVSEVFIHNMQLQCG